MLQIGTALDKCGKKAVKDVDQICDHIEPRGPQISLGPVNNLVNICLIAEGAAPNGLEC
jgi:hypothetical protein